jgi:hypothetical protein
MPIIRFAAVTGAILLALLFVADATLKPRGPLFTNNSEGLTRSESIRTQQAQRTPEAPRPRAPALVQTAQEAAPAAKPVAPRIAEIAEAVETPPATAQAATEVVKSDVASTESAKTESAKINTAKAEPVKAEPARIETAKLEAAATEPAKSETVGRGAVTAAPKAAQRETTGTAPPKTRKQIARKLERGNRYAYRDGTFSQDDVPAAENGYAYGVARRRPRPEWQRPWGGEFGENRYRF